MINENKVHSVRLHTYNQNCEAKAPRNLTSKSPDGIYLLEVSNAQANMIYAFIQNIKKASV